ncbi:MAG: hypothetical protein RI911_821 [Candidatus Parcubacteria bacterium]|jgi:hypothetical protein
MNRILSGYHAQTDAAVIPIQRTTTPIHALEYRCAVFMSKAYQSPFFFQV